jgi:hypothetical protein
MATTMPTDNGARPARMATGMSTAPTSGTAGVGQKNNEITYVTTASTRKLLVPVRITRRKGVTMRRSAPTSRSAPSIAVTKAMIRKMLNSSLAATRLALKMAERPVITLPENAHAVSKVAATAGTTMFLRIAIVSRMTTMPPR